MDYNNKRMRCLALSLCLLTECLTTTGQGLSEWFNQKQTQVKYYLTQIAGLQLYAGYLEKGYKIVKTGTNIIGEIKRGDLNLHGDYFKSLKTVNPSIRRYSKVNKIVDMQLQLLSVYHKSIKSATKSDLFSRGELNYCSNVFSNLLSESEDILDVLLMVVSSGKIEMKDNDRINKIDELYIDIQDKLAFAQKFSRETEVLIALRRTEGSDLKTSRLINGFK